MATGRNRTATRRKPPVSTVARNRIPQASQWDVRMGRNVMGASAPTPRLGLHRLLGSIEWNQRAIKDAGVICVIAVISLIASEWFDLFAAMMKFQAIYGNWGLDDLAMALIVLAFALAAYTW